MFRLILAIAITLLIIYFLGGGIKETHSRIQKGYLHVCKAVSLVKDIDNCAKSAKMFRYKLERINR